MGTMADRGGSQRVDAATWHTCRAYWKSRVPYGESVMNAIRLSCACLGVVFASGCMQARIEESRELATPVAKGERVVILAKPQIEGAGAEDAFMDCVSDSMADGRHGIAVHDNNEFVDKMFPWFEPSTAPGKPEALSALLARPGVAERVTESGVRSEEHTSELQSQSNLVCRLLLEKKK